MDPAKALAILYVSQFLHEEGYDEVLRALERKSGVLYDDTKVERSSQLLQLIWRQMEEQASEEIAEAGSAAAQEAAQEEAMLRGGRNDFPEVITQRIDNVHPASVVCVRLIPGCKEVLTGSGDGNLRRVGFDGNLSWCTAVGSGGVLCMDLHPAAYCLVCPHNGHSPQPNHSHEKPVGGAAITASRSQAEMLHLHDLVAAGSMDGSVTIVHLSQGHVLATDRCHAKYVVRVAWAGEGHQLVSCSHDMTVAIHSVELPTQYQQAHQQQEGQPAAVQTQSAVQLTTLRKVQYASAVQDVCFLQDGVTLIVALRDTNYLRVLSLKDPDGLEQMVNLNASGDDHVSFFARHLVPSPDGVWLLVSTSTGRLLVLRTATWKVCTRFLLYALPADNFHQFCACWHRDSHYVFAGAPGGQVWVYHVGSGKVVARIKAHKINVRDLDYDADRNLLATCSFDKSCAILLDKSAAEDAGFT